MEAKFSPRVKDVITYSREEALRLGHDYIGIEHLMLGMIRDGDGVGMRLLKNLGVDSLDFKNTIIIMTSNIGARQLKDFGAGVGFGTQTRKENEDEISKGVIESALKKAFAPEFLNRIDDVVMIFVF